MPSAIEELWRHFSAVRSRAGDPKAPTIVKEAAERLGVGLPEATVRGWIKQATVRTHGGLPRNEDHFIAVITVLRLRVETPTTSAGNGRPTTLSKQEKEAWLSRLRAAKAEEDAAGPAPTGKQPHADPQEPPPSSDLRKPIEPGPGLPESPPPPPRRRRRRTAATRTAEVAADSLQQPPQRRLTVSGQARSQRLIKAAIILGLVIVVAGLTVGGLNVWQALTHEDSSKGPTAAPTATPTSTQPTSKCDRYEVAAADLWLRDEHGTPQTKISQGQRVTVTNRRNPSKLPYWHIRTDDNLVGWVDHRLLHSLCAGA